MTPRLSVITAVHNGLALNEFYWKWLTRNTVSPFELVVIDNHSTDGSETFFQNLFVGRHPDGQRVVYVRNEKNQSYPKSRIQGMAHASADVLVFLNNDVWVPPAWHLPFERELADNPFQVLSPSGQEAQPTQALSDALKRRGRRVTQLSRAWQFFRRASERDRLEWSVRRMYGDLDRFQSPTPLWETDSIPGIKGDCVVFHRRLLEKLPHPWDERIEAADWHLYLTLANLNELHPEIPLPRILLDTYVHHFGCARSNDEPLDRKEPPLTIAEFWGEATVRRLWWDYHLRQA